MKRVLCWLIGHKWQNVREVCHLARIITHLHPLAGCAADCARCGVKWFDSCARCEAQAKER